MFFPKLKGLSFGLAAVLFLAFSFTACTSEEDNLRPVTEKVNLEKGLVLPTEIFAQGPEVVKAHLDQIDEATRVEYMASYIVGKHLAANGQMVAAFANLSGIENLTDLNSADYMDATQVAQLEIELAAVTSSSIERECVPVCYWDGTRWVFAGYYMC